MEPFAYFRDPQHPLSAWSTESRTCDICGMSGPGFDGPYYGPDEIERVCETCLRSGRLAEVSHTTCEGDGGALARQLAARADIDPTSRRALLRERSAVLEYATPHLITWQEIRWPAHCGDYCCFVEEVGKPEIRELARDEDPAAWCSAHLHTDAPIPWESVRERSSREHPTESYALTVYRFVCRECGTTVLHWDSN